ncbi:MAG: hypothetical protein ACPGWR_14510 [Ardenticatenaceae bacterium]
MMNNKKLWASLSFIIGVLALLLGGWFTNWPLPILSVDVKQERLDHALPLPRNGVEIRQVFYARHDGLREVELQLARFDLGESEQKGGELVLRLFDDQNEVVAEQTIQTDSLTHNQIWRWRLPRQDESGGRAYMLQVTGNEFTPFSLWGYTLDAQAGDLSVTAATEARELRFVTYYELTFRAAITHLGRALSRDGVLFELALAFILMPGCLMLLLARRWLGEWDFAAWWGAALALGLSFWALIWYWLTLAGLRWSSGGLWLVLALGWGAVLLLWGKQNAWGNRNRSRLRPEHGVLLLVLLGGLAVRLLAVRDLVFPLWVDAVRHALITTVMANKGQVLFDYAPLLPMIDRFPYHFGYHTLSASLLMMTDWSLPVMMLSLGQLLNALMPLSVYSAAWLMTERRDVGLFAAFLVAFPFFFPGYYATWGRFTQLTGMLIMCVLVAMTWRLVRVGVCRGNPSRLPTGRATARVRPNNASHGTWWLVGLLAAGLFLVHLRVFIYYLPFPLLVWLYRRGRGTRWLVAAGGLGGLLVAPRIWYLLPRNSIRQLSNRIPDYNAFPTGYAEAGWESYFIALAGLSVLMVLIAAVRKERWASVPLLLTLWVGALFGLLGGDYIGLPESWLVNLNSMYITLFFPLALLLAISAIQLWRGVLLLSNKMSWAWLPLLLIAPLGALLTAMLLFGIRNQITILNEKTILAHSDDMAAIEWVANNTPPSARIAISSWSWLGGTWAGSDGGSWLVPLTGRYSSTPPADYIYNRPLAEQVNTFNEAAHAIEDWSDPQVVEWLREQEITHLFIGVKGGYLDPAELHNNPALIMRYGKNGTFVFEVSTQ